MKSFQLQIDNKLVTFEVNQSGNEYYVVLYWNGGSANFKGTAITYNGKRHFRLNHELPQMLKCFQECELLKLLEDNINEME